MNPETEGLLKELREQLDEEILYTHLLFGEMKKESDYLRTGATDSLMASLRSLEIYTAEIRKIRGAIQKKTEALISCLGVQDGSGLARLLPLLPPEEAQRVKDALKTLANLRKAIAQVNSRNKNFVQETLTCWKEMFSLLVRPLSDTPLYIQSGKAQPPAASPVSLNRRV
ncbi:MAG TPA: flagellar export chaperone FlgN [Thermodesulfobacteriota bacterium]|nr:flagellar export chaperone FlgN [Thermodesulfobacteriota bacterium]